MVWNDDLLDPESEEFRNRKKEIELEVIIDSPLDILFQKFINL